MDPFFVPVLITGAFAGVAIGMLGVFIVGMRMPFIGSCISHTAMVGAVYAALWNLNPTAGAIGLSMAAAAGAALIPPDKKTLDANTGQAILLSSMMGLAFLAVGLEQGSRNEMLALLWGNVLFADWGTAAATGALTAGLVLFMVVFDKELKAILFSRSLAAATGMHANLVYLLFLCFCGLILAVTLQVVGGLLIFSLLVCPAAAASQLCRGYRAVLVASGGFGLLSTVVGFTASFCWNLPTGACIVIAGTLIFLGALVVGGIVGRGS